MNKKKVFISAAAVIVLAGAGMWIFGGKKASQTISFSTSVVQKGTISNSITATGTIEPVTEVEVGTQVSGIIDKIYVDYNSEVKAGQVIAEMDRVTLISDLQSAQATYDGAEAEYIYQEKLYERNKKLYSKQLISDTEYEQYEYNYRRAKSAYDQSKAALAKAQRNLSYTTITSPINGVVTSREVEAGQTVASGFETPTLFTIAADLTKMQVVADVDEADIAGVKDSARVTFTVDAYPDDVFEGRVKQIRLGSTNSSSSTSTTSETVVTYEVVITADNPELKLKPRLTANVTIFTDTRENVLVVPNKALRFNPDKKIAGGKTIKDCDSPKKVWTMDATSFTAHPVKTGMNDGSNTEIISGISEGTEIVTETVVKSEMPEMMPEEGGEGEQNPFMPGPPGRNNKKK
ncbi:efflux RND transporter periplasmic adaptor subunit [Bacteroides caecigallinarum]|uniref:efflux RND transporter periplasmic adaptor subunit n=1 Tax=Bacteroides caecigallinarum TaxID=1411144 RepID=UPI00195AD88B|nr:efflux RND transporter periplasmic adaptor subunit [Bacteroides caecigallinarum]MBM6882061.1 efflux RND transporter periplasmic adaptor subunit [Bacteroides caecigallinarum]MBM6888908.1 efflux RND transporter periplasmic adaptor subunit [Bacteroides caecigallinarum]